VKRARAARALSYALILVAFALPARAAEPSYPEPTDYVVDTAGLLTDDTKAHVDAIAKELDEKTGVQIAVAVVPSIAPLEIEDYAVTLFKKWGVGNKKEDTGILLVVAEKERRVRFEVGYGLEGLLPDGRVGGILRHDVVPHLHDNDWNGGVLAGVVAVATIVADDRKVTLTSLQGAAPPPEDDTGDHIPPRVLLFVGFLAVVIILNAIARAQQGPYRRRGGWGGYGGWGGFGGFGGGSSGGGGFGGFGGGSSGGGGASSGF